MIDGSTVPDTQVYPEDIFGSFVPGTQDYPDTLEYLSQPSAPMDKVRDPCVGAPERETSSSPKFVQMTDPYFNCIKTPDPVACTRAQVMMVQTLP